MELMQLEVFVAVVEERSFLKAAERVLRTQPAVSIALGKLERGLGISLFDRSGRRAYGLTPAGKVLYEYASRMVGLRNEVAGLLEGKEDQRIGRLCVGVDEPAAFPWLPEVISAFRERYPQVRVEVLSDRAEQLLHDLRERTTDMVLVSTQSEFDGPGGELLVLPFPAGIRERAFWLLQPRMGRSHLAVGFEEAVIAHLRKPSVASSSPKHRYRKPSREGFRAQPVGLRAVPGPRERKAS